MSSGASNFKEGAKVFLSLYGANAAYAVKLLASDAAAGGFLLLKSLVPGASGNDLKVEVTDPGPDDCALAASMGGSGNNTLTIALGRTGSSTNSAKNTILLIAAAVDAIATNKKIRTVTAGDTAQKITATAVAADFDGGVVSSVSGGEYDHPNFNEALVVLSLGEIEDGADLTVTIDGREEGGSPTAIPGAVFSGLGTDDSYSVLTGTISLVDAPKYLRASSSITGGTAEHSVVFVFGGGQYRVPSENTHTFTV